jgi:restriction system protein
MPIPDYQSCMLPLLKISKDNKEHSFRDAVEIISNEFNLTKEEREILLPSGIQCIIDNRVGWARTYLTKAGLLKSPRRGYFQITERGFELLKTNPPEVNTKMLTQYDEFKEFRARRKEKGGQNEQSQIEHYTTPEEALEYGYQKINENLADDLISKIKECTPSFFEKLVVELLVKMGYGGTLKEAGKIIGQSGDEGVDGIIKEDRLGLDVIYIQAKRWNNVVGRPEIQKFAGALLGKKAHKGIFITTSYFSNDAIEYADNIENKIVLIDGEKLTDLMIEHNLGVNIQRSIEIKKIDIDYFIED